MSKQYPLLSIIITTKDNASQIINCLSSIKEQRYKKLEIIVVDNNSTDETKQISLKYTNKVFNHGPERSAQRNFGAERSSGQYILFLDSDMLLGKNVLTACASEMENTPHLVGLAIPEKSFGKSFWAKCKTLERSFYIGVEWMEGARFFKRKVFEEFGGYDTQMTGTEDFDLPQKIKMKYGLKSIRRINKFIFHNEGNLSLWHSLKKKFYYAQTVSLYKKNEVNKTYFIKQADILERYKLFISNPRKLFKNPKIACGMIFMKTCEFFVGGLSYLLVNLKKRSFYSQKARERVRITI